MSDITQLNASLTKLRVARLQYMLTNGDEAAAQNVQTTLESFSAQQQALLASSRARKTSSCSMSKARHRRLQDVAEQDARRLPHRQQRATSWAPTPKRPHADQRSQ
jgi:hypothetical protein